ncbi:MAG TPA: hypothetical protein VFV63_20005 [Ilumatobacteraceae bacterium]|nr:hypothetical protein [Ilumatobacteraceae bacterium]
MSVGSSVSHGVIGVVVVLVAATITALAHIALPSTHAGMTARASTV